MKRLLSAAMLFLAAVMAYAAPAPARAADYPSKTITMICPFGAGSGADIISRSVARGHSRQQYRSQIIGNARCTGHSECDAIIMDEGVVSAIPEVTANCLDAQLVHEAAIGKIAGDQILKLMTLGLTEQEAEAQIVNGFLK